jgi:hypothetical protein
MSPILVGRDTERSSEGMREASKLIFYPMDETPSNIAMGGVSAIAPGWMEVRSSLLRFSA